MTRAEDIRERVRKGRALVGLGTTCNVVAVLLDDIEWLLSELEATA